jgi:transposase
MVAANARIAVGFILSGGEVHDAPAGRALLKHLGPTPRKCHLIMDKAYEGAPVRQLALSLGYEPVVPPKFNRVNPWDYDRELYKRRNEIERLFRRIKGFRRIFSRFDKLDAMFLGFLQFALIIDGLK